MCEPESLTNTVWRRPLDRETTRTAQRHLTRTRFTANAQDVVAVLVDSHFATNTYPCPLPTCTTHLHSAPTYNRIYLHVLYRLMYIAYTAGFQLMFFFLFIRVPPRSKLFLYRTLFFFFLKSTRPTTIHSPTPHAVFRF